MADLTGGKGEGGRLSEDEVAGLSGHVSTLAAAGLPLGPGLTALGEELPDGRLRASLLDLGRALEGGMPLDEAMALQKRRIPAHLRGIVLGGLKSGRLGDVLGRFTGYVSIGTELRRRLWLSMAYPVFTIVLTLILLVLVDVFVVSMFESIFRDFGVPIPMMTVALIETSHVIRAVWPGLAVVGLVLAGLWLAGRLAFGGPAVRGILARLPVLGAVWRYTGWAEFCHLLALLLESRLPLPEALRLTGEGVENSGLARASDSMARDVENGRPLAATMGKQPELPPNLPRLIRWAGDHDATADLLHAAGEMYEARARSQAAFAGTVMAVLSAVIVFVGVSIGVIGLFLPLITLITKLSG
ncbi:Putative type II secretion system protein F [Aquisphaera giovannonii]|uniref:Type II secretion system protein F n=1 Tax=Aquisphaera giovannonii TaxID=406548 RepID=A0A5B9W8U5_9BACT|nr:type II secretion system F family protein [Aquisphaera giovannonii]QEH37028.1 Putative type II secretion system protein F [Aquisphaera giovannonii]